MKELGPLKRNVNWSSAVKASVSFRYLWVAQYTFCIGCKDRFFLSLCWCAVVVVVSFLARGLLLWLFLSSSFNMIVKRKESAVGFSVRKCVFQLFSSKRKEIERCNEMMMFMIYVQCNVYSRITLILWTSDHLIRRFSLLWKLSFLQRTILDSRVFPLLLGERVRFL